MKKSKDWIKILQTMQDEFRDINLLNEFILLSCAPDILSLRIFPNIKEVSESMAAFNAIRRFLPSGWSFNENVLCLSVADGTAPRTAVLLAFMTKWNLISCDPLMREDHINRCKNVRQLTCYPTVVQDIPNYKTKRVCIVAVHAHNQIDGEKKRGSILDAAIKKVDAEEYFVIALPCCDKLTIEDRKPLHEYKDIGMWTEKNMIKVWSFNR